MAIMAAMPALLFLLDTLVKRRIDRMLKPEDKKPICRGRLVLRKYYNKGAALNFLASRPKAVQKLNTLAVGALAGIYAFMLGKKGGTGLKISLGLVLGGGASNLLDRYTKGGVLDYLSLNVRWKRIKNIVFNLSDIFILFGMLLLTFFGWRGSDSAK